MAGKKTREAGQRLARRRRRVTASCAVCGAAISGLVTRRYCGNACRLRASRQRRRERAGGAGQLSPLILRLNVTAARLASSHADAGAAPLVARFASERTAE